MNTTRWALALLAAAPLSAVAQEALEELLVLGRHDSRTIDVSDALTVNPDPARLLYRAPGANATTNGPITGIPQIRGLFGHRVSVALDQSLLAPAGPNWMDPAISYAVTAQLESLEVYRGITPVSIAQESLGGVIQTNTRRMAYASSDQWETESRLMGSAQSVNDGQQFDAEVQAANQHHRVRAALMWQEGDDAEFPGGDILPSSYERGRYDLGYGFSRGRHSFQIDFGYTDTGEAGTPALPMDIDYFDGELLSATYRYQWQPETVVSLAAYGSDLDHGMTNFHLRRPPASPAMWRQNIATTENRGFQLRVDHQDERGVWRVGVDGFEEIHQSDIDAPNNAMFFVTNFNDAERQVLGVFAEYERDVGEALQLEVGIRTNVVTTNAGEVNGTPAIMMPPAAALRDAFNAADRKQRDTNVDAFLKLTTSVSESITAYAGVASKTRAPAYQERYLWLPLEATAGLADGQLYLGNIDLDPERSNQVEFGFDFQRAKVVARPRLFYYRVDDYIQGTPVASTSAGAMFVRMMNNMNGSNRGAPLQFNNVDAELFGFDMDWSWQLSDRLSASGLVNVVRGQRRDVDDDLYRIAPPNASLRLDYSLNTLQMSVEGIVYAEQDRVSTTNRETQSPGYGVVNLAARWQVADSLAVTAGIDNVFDKRYAPHLGGYNRAGNPDVAMFERLPAPGANLFGRLEYRF